VIDTERADIPGIYKSDIAPLAIFSALCGLAGELLFGVGLLSPTPPLLTLIGDAILSVVIALGLVYVFALIIDALAPSFGARKNFNQAFKVAAYSPTAAWLGGIFLIFPQLALLSAVAALYSLYLLFVGLRQLMSPPAARAVPYAFIVIVCAVGLSLVVSWLLIAVRFV
jgi:hypothetical protein